jgi:glycosyltransferase involved in cell wall biosynthesis
MRIVFLTHYKELYGANRSLLNLIEGLTSFGVLPFVVSPRSGELSNVLDSRHIPNVIIPMRPWMGSDFSGTIGIKYLANYFDRKYRAAKRLNKNLRALPALVKQMKEWQVDAIYSNSSVIPNGAMASAWLKLPHIWHIREFVKQYFGLRYDWGEQVYRATLRHAKARIAISESVRRQILKDGIAENNYVIYNGVAWQAEFDRYHKYVQSGQPIKDTYNFAVIGRIEPGKGQLEAIRALSIAAKAQPSIRLIIAGTGSENYIQSCKRLVTELGLADKVEFTGYVTDPYQVFFRADAILVCSRFEAMGRVTAEAMAASRPVIGYNNAGTSELIEHERTGLLYRDGPEELAICMLHFIENPAWACQLGENGWHIAREKYSIERYAQQVYDVIQSVVTP